MVRQSDDYSELPVMNAKQPINQNAALTMASQSPARQPMIRKIMPLNVNMIHAKSSLLGMGRA